MLHPICNCRLWVYLFWLCFFDSLAKKAFLDRSIRKLFLVENQQSSGMLVIGSKWCKIKRLDFPTFWKIQPNGACWAAAGPVMPEWSVWEREKRQVRPGEKLAMHGNDLEKEMFGRFSNYLCVGLNSNLKWNFKFERYCQGLKLGSP